MKRHLQFIKEESEKYDMENKKRKLTPATPTTTTTTTTTNTNKHKSNIISCEDEGLNEIRILNDIEKEIVRLEQEQKKIHSERISRVDKDIKSVLNSQSVNVLQHINKIPTNTICSLCATDFLPCFLNMLDNKTEEKVDVNTYLMSCIRCAGRICFKCTFKIITLNPLHNNSIGFACPFCRFYNCNFIDVFKHNKLSFDEKPSITGLSTVKTMKGCHLPTTSNEFKILSHEENMIREQDERDVDILFERHERISDNPGSPYYSPSSPQYGSDDESGDNIAYFG